MPDLTISNLTAPQLAALTTALTGAGVPFTTSQLFYTADEARALLDQLGHRQRTLVSRVADWDGVLPATELRDLDSSSLRGITGPITRIVNRLIKDGTLRPGHHSPIHPVYDPDNRSFQRVRAYKMDTADVAAFQAATTS